MQMQLRRLGRAAALAGAAGALLLIFAPPAQAAPSISAVNPASPVLAGTTVTVNASGFPANSTVRFHWDGVLVSDMATSDGTGSIAGAPVVVPLSLAPGPHSINACSPVTTCSAGYAMVVGPIVTTSATMPVHRGQTIPITVAGLQAGQTAIFGWNGTFLPSPAITIPDAASFPASLTVPSNAPASTVLDVCERTSGTSCTTTVATKGTLALTVAIPPPTPTPTSSPSSVPPSSSAPATSSAPPTPTATVTTPHASATPHASTSASAATVVPAPPTSTPATGPAPTPTPTPPPAHIAALYTPKAVVHLEVAAFSLLTLVGGQSMLRGIAGLAVPGAAEAEAEAGAAEAGGAAGARAPSGRIKGGTAGGAKVKDIKGTGGDGGAAGDRSRSWRWPWTRRLDAVALAVPVRVAPRSPLLARVLVDASYLRAMIGSLSLLLPLVGLVLGALAVSDTHATATPPIIALLGGIAVLSVFDAVAGLLAALVFVVGVAVTGHLDSAIAVRTMIGLGVVWFAVPLIAGAARPLRRRLDRSAQAYRQRVGDLVIASLIGAWALQKMVLGLPGLAQRPLAVTHDAGTLALVVLGASALRIGFETAAAVWYPTRLGAVQPVAVPKPASAQRIAAVFLRTAVFVFFAVAFVGDHWQLWVGALIFLVPQLFSIYESTLPNSPRLYAWLPRGLLKLVVMLFVGAAFGSYVLHRLKHTHDAALDAFVLLTIPGLVLGGLELFGRDGHEPDEGWARWSAGFVVLVIGVLFVFGYLS